MGYQVTFNLAMSAEALSANLTTDDLTATLISSMGLANGSNAQIVIVRRTTISVDLGAAVAGANETEYRSAVETAVCAPYATASCTVAVAADGERRRRLLVGAVADDEWQRRLQGSGEDGERRRRLQGQANGQAVRFVVSVVLASGASLATNAASSEALTAALTSALAAVLNSTNLTVTFESSTVEATVILSQQGTPEEAQAAASTILSAQTITATIAASLGLDPSALQVAAPTILFPPRPPPSPTTCERTTGGTCAPCAAGTYKPGRADWNSACTACEACGDGMFRSGCGALASGVCLACAKGFYKRNASATWDTPCSPCEPCPAGFVRTECGWDRPGICRPCAAGQYKNATGSWDARCTLCHACPGGAMRVGCGGSSPGTCEPCASGTYKLHMEGAHLLAHMEGRCLWHEPCRPCRPCRPGTYLVGCGNSSQGVCETCPAGTFKSEDSAWDTPCSPVQSCAPGTFRIGPSASYGGQCAQCAHNHYKNVTGSWNSLCLPCASCPVGEYRVFCGPESYGSCAPCPFGEYKADSSPGACVNCQPCAPANFRPLVHAAVGVGGGVG